MSLDRFGIRSVPPCSDCWEDGQCSMNCGPKIRAEVQSIAPRWGNEERSYTLAKRHAKYIFGVSKNACLVHKIREVRLRWWEAVRGGDHLARLSTPKMTAITNCGQWMAISARRGGGRTCDVPAPDAVLCKTCHGEGKNFPHGRVHEVPRSLARIRKRCMVGGEAI